MNRLSLIAFILLAAAPLLAQAPTESLAALIESGDRKAALERIRSGVDVNAAQPDGTRPIHWAAYRVDYELLEALIARKADLNVRNEFGATPIAQAAELADARMVKMLLDAGADVEGPNPDGQTALMLAIRTGEMPVVEMLIDAGANVNTIERFHNQTPLMWAAAASLNAGAMVKLLLSKGADFKPRALFSDWPSQITSEPRAQYRPTGGLTAFLYAARNGCADCIDALLAAGDDIDRPTPEGVTPLMIALDNDRNDVAKLLLDRGANPRLWDWWGRTALYVAIDRKASAGDRRLQQLVTGMDIVNALLAAGVDVNAQLNMHRPSRSGNSGRFIDPLLNTGCTPLLRAAIARDVEVVRALLSAGAEPDISGMGLTPFLVAAGVGRGHIEGTGLAAETSIGGPVNMEIVDVLIERGADVNAQITGTRTYNLRVTRAPSRNEGQTALHYSVQEGRTDLVRYLLLKGATPEIVDAAGKKPIDLVGTPSYNVPAGAAPKPPDPVASAEIRALLEAAGK